MLLLVNLTVGSVCKWIRCGAPSPASPFNHAVDTSGSAHRSSISFSVTSIPAAIVYPAMYHISTRGPEPHHRRATYGDFHHTLIEHCLSLHQACSLYHSFGDYIPGLEALVIK